MKFFNDTATLSCSLGVGIILVPFCSFTCVNFFGYEWLCSMLKTGLKSALNSPFIIADQALCNIADYFLKPQWFDSLGKDDSSLYQHIFGTDKCHLKSYEDAYICNGLSDSIFAFSLVIHTHCITYIKDFVLIWKRIRNNGKLLRILRPCTWVIFLQYHKSKNHFYIDKTIRMSLIRINPLILLIPVSSDVTCLDWSHLPKA